MKTVINIKDGSAWEKKNDYFEEYRVQKNSNYVKYKSKMYCVLAE